VLANVGAGIEGHAEGCFELDPPLLCIDDGSSYCELNVGANAAAQGSICVNLPWPIPDLDWQFDII
jgi:hypothetical protein